jgi:hypothetical protein
VLKFHRRMVANRLWSSSCKVKILLVFLWAFYPENVYSDAIGLDPISVDSYSPNYIPVSDGDIGWDDVEIGTLYSRYTVKDGSDGDCNQHWFITVDLKFKADNGVIYKTVWSHDRNGYVKRFTCDAKQEFSFYGEHAKMLLGPNPGPWNSDNEGTVRTKFSNEYSSILSAINNQIASMQGGLPLPPPDPNDTRKLAVPVLFVHGIGDSAQRWGVSYARRECGNPTVTQLGQPTISPFQIVSKEQRQKTEVNEQTGVSELVFTRDPENWQAGARHGNRGDSKNIFGSYDLLSDCRL